MSEMSATLKAIAKAAVMAKSAGSEIDLAIFKMAPADLEAVNARIAELSTVKVKSAGVKAQWLLDNAQAIAVAIASLPAPEGYSVKVTLVKDATDGENTEKPEGGAKRGRHAGAIEVSGGDATKKHVVVLAKAEKFEDFRTACAKLLPGDPTAESYPSRRILESKGFIVTDVATA